MATLTNNKFENEECKRLLILEGSNDCYVITALRNQLKIAKNFNIIDGKSDAEAQDKFLSLIDQHTKTVLGLVLDADNDLQDKWLDLQKMLVEDYNIEIPDRPVLNGFILPQELPNPRLGIWFMPDNKNQGMLEDFCCEIADQNVLNFAKQCVDEAKQNSHATFKDVHLKKAELSTYLAWQDPPGMKMGQAVTKGILRAENPLAQDFSDWLKKLFQQQ